MLLPLWVGIVVFSLVKWLLTPNFSVAVECTFLLGHFLHQPHLQTPQYSILMSRYSAATLSDVCDMYRCIAFHQFRCLLFSCLGCWGSWKLDSYTWLTATTFPVIVGALAWCWSLTSSMLWCYGSKKRSVTVWRVLVTNSGYVFFLSDPMDKAENKPHMSGRRISSSATQNCCNQKTTLTWPQLK